MDNAILSALTYLGETMDKPGSALRGLVVGQPDQLLNLIPFSDTLGITDPSRRVSGRDVLESFGMLDANRPGLDWGDAAGFLAEEALDPINWIPGGILAKQSLKWAGQAPLLSRMMKSSPGLRWADDVPNLEARLADQEVDDIFADWAFEKRRMEAIPPAYQFPESGTTFEADEVRDLLEAYNAREYARRYGAAGEPVAPEELESLYRALHDRRLGRYRDWLGQNAVLDENGNPLKLYHGSGAVFDEFRLGEKGGAGGDLVGRGVYLTNDPEIASSYATRPGFNPGPVIAGGAVMPRNVSTHHAIGPVADFMSMSGLDASHRQISKALPSVAEIDASFDSLARKKLLRDIEMDLLDDIYYEMDMAIDSQNRLGVEDVTTAWGDASQSLTRLIQQTVANNTPADGVDYARSVIPQLDAPASFAQVLPDATGIKHPGGTIFGGPAHDAFVMFDPKNVVPANPSPRVLQLIAERFRDAQGNLPFGILAAMAGGGAAAAYGGQDVY